MRESNELQLNYDEMNISGLAPQTSQVQQQQMLGLGQPSAAPAPTTLASRARVPAATASSTLLRLGPHLLDPKTTRLTVLPAYDPDDALSHQTPLSADDTVALDRIIQADTAYRALKAREKTQFETEHRPVVERWERGDWWELGSGSSPMPPPPGSKAGKKDMQVMWPAEKRLRRDKEIGPRTMLTL